MKTHSALRRALSVLAAILLVLGILIGLACDRMRAAVGAVERVDDSGLLYSVEYTARYDDAFTKLPSAIIRTFGCSAFCARNEAGDVITARNYDLLHKDADGDPTGLNVVLTLRPEGKYASVNIADAAWFTKVGIPYTAGALDEGGASRLFLAFLPYFCMDGMNEKGLTVSILALDVKEGETAVHQTEKGKKSVMITEMLRLLLDNCADADEAAALAAEYDLKNTLGSDYHLFVTDAAGNSLVLEWRYDTLYITRQDAVTNFYTAFDDAEDCYRDGVLKEAFTAAEGLTREYHYGYGHGYGRFRTIAERLDAHITDPAEPLASVSEAEAMDILAAAAQVYDGTDLTSDTQYSVIYNAASLTAEVCVGRNYADRYTFSLADGGTAAP